MPSGEREPKLALDKVKRPQVVAKKHNSNQALLPGLLFFLLSQTHPGCDSVMEGEEPRLIDSKVREILFRKLSDYDS